jgi:cytochrome c peroxidase
VIQKLKALGYESAFKAAFPGDPEPIKPDNWGKAIGSYERTLVTPAPFDAYLQGQPAALPDAAQRGLKTFIETGCANCHGGVGLGGTAFQKFGVVSDYWLATGNPERDSGRFAITQDPADQYRFKVPGLRNVGMTAPYFHDGSVADLAQAVRIMGQVQLGQTLTPGQVADLVAFLKSLTGTVPQHFAPESSPIAAP